VKVAEPGPTDLALLDEPLDAAPEAEELGGGLLLPGAHRAASDPQQRQRLNGGRQQQHVHAVGAQLGQRRLHRRQQGANVEVVEEDLEGDLQLVPDVVVGVRLGAVQCSAVQ
jgi:hypothetical protein